MSAEIGKSNQVGGKEAFREEHSPPASVVGGSLIWAIKNGQVKQIMQGIRDNYIQVKLSKKDDVIQNLNNQIDNLKNKVLFSTNDFVSDYEWFFSSSQLSHSCSDPILQSVYQAP